MWVTEAKKGGVLMGLPTQKEGLSHWHLLSHVTANPLQIMNGAAAEVSRSVM